MYFMKETWDDVSFSRQSSAVDMHLLLHLPHRRAHPHCIRTLPTSIFPTHPSIFPIFPIFNCRPYPDLKRYARRRPTPTSTSAPVSSSVQSLFHRSRLSLFSPHPVARLSFCR